MEKIYRIAAINLGSTSTKITYYENETCLLKDSIPHAAEELAPYSTIWEQEEYRKSAIEAFLNRNGIDPASLDAVVTRGGHTEPIHGGVWKINKTMLEQSRSEKYGNHVSDLGLRIAAKMGEELGIPAFTVDTPTTNEFEPLAKYSGLPSIERASRFHVLNHRAVGKQYAKDIGRPYEEMNLITAHMGGGITVSAAKHGKLVDATNGLDGDGPFSTNRTGGLPVGDLVKMCYSGQYTLAEMKRILNGKGGMVAYTGENDVKTMEERAAAGDAKADEIISAMCYQTAKEIAACAAVLCGKVDAILLTGGIVHSKKIVGILKERIGWIAPVEVYPGELEMQSLSLQTLAALRGEEEINVLGE